VAGDENHGGFKMTGLLITTIALPAVNLFAERFGGTNNERFYSVAQTPDGGFALAGTTNSYGVGGDDIFLVVVPPAGKNIVWAKTYGGTGNDRAYSLVPTADSGFVLVGSTTSFGAGSGNMFVLKLDKNGNISWAKTYGIAGGSGEARSVVQVLDLTGYAVAGSYNDEPVILRLDRNGNVSWAKTYSGTGWTVGYLYSIAQTSDEDFAVTGLIRDVGFNPGIPFLLLSASDGSVMRSKFLFGQVNGEYPVFDQGNSIIQTSDGGFAITGITDINLADIAVLVILKLNALGNLSWAKATTGVWEYGESLIQTSEDALVVAGYSRSLNRDALVMKMSSTDGGLIWSTTFNATTEDHAYSVIQATDGALAVAGETYDLTQRDGFLFKITGSGSYPGCVSSGTPSFVTPTFITPSLSVSASPWSYSTTNPSFTVGSPFVSTVLVCTPVYEDVGENGTGNETWITCSPVPGGIIFKSQEELCIRLYSADGQLVLRDNLKEGQTRINLDPGVYLWQAGAYRGKAAVR
jgi:hypothetical protein